METFDVIHKGNLLSAHMILMNNSNPNPDVRTSREMTIGGTALFQVRVACTMFDIMHPCYNLLFVRFRKDSNVDDNLTYKIFVKSAELKIEGMMLSSNDYTWHLIYETKRDFKFTITAELRLQPSPSTFAPLLDDEGQMDFELRGEDGSVRVHRAVLAAASPMLRSMLNGAWRKTAEGVVDVAGTTKDTLEAFRNFVYSRVMPESGLEQLLLLSTFYAMPDLERLCVDRLVLGMTAENLCDLIEFASLNKMKQLLITVVECAQAGAVNIMEVREHMEKSKPPPKPEPERKPEPELEPEPQQPEPEPQQPEQS